MEIEIAAPLTEQKKKLNKNGLYVHYGCGLTAPGSWINFDASPTLRIQRMPLIGSLLRKKIKVVFPSNARYGNIVQGLPGIKESSCEGVYCSHILEHLSLNDFRTALKNTFLILKPGGVFRCVVPDLEYAAREYLRALEEGHADASIRFVGNYTLLGKEYRPKKLSGIMASAFGYSHHLWMWDRQSLLIELKKAGFRNIRQCTFNDSDDAMFDLVEEKHRFDNAVAFHCVK